MKLNSQYPNKKFTIRVKDLSNKFDFLIKRKVYVNSKNEYCVNYLGNYYNILLTSYSPYIGTITVSQSQGLKA